MIGGVGNWRLLFSVCFSLGFLGVGVDTGCLFGSWILVWIESVSNIIIPPGTRRGGAVLYTTGMRRTEAEGVK